MADDLKSKPCHKFARGECKFGEQCHYSHSADLIKHETKQPCRAFARGECKFGDQCRFEHSADAAEQGLCRDFQKGLCDRRNCKFAHIGEPGIGDCRPPSTGNPNMDVCRNFLNNRCDRNRDCKYRHVTQRELDIEQGCAPPLNHAPQPPMEYMYGKRPRNDASFRDQSEEIDALHRKVTGLQKDVLELRKMNDELYDQNKHYREQLKPRASELAPPDEPHFDVRGPSPATFQQRY